MPTSTKSNNHATRGVRTAVKSLHASVLALGLLQAQQPPSPTFHEVAITSANGRFAAEIRKAAGQERVADAIARWRLSVYELPRAADAKPAWSYNVQHPAGERPYFLADDGRAVVALEPEYAESRPLARVWRDDETRAEWSAALLDIDRSQLPRTPVREWLAAGEPAPHVAWVETPRGPVEHLSLRTSYGEPRFLDLQTFEVRTSIAPVLDLSVAPAASRAERPDFVVPRTTRYAAPAIAYWGEPLVVSVSGAFPTPNWVLRGFDSALGGADGRTIVLAPLSAAPPSGAVQLQVIRNFDAHAVIAGLVPGNYVLRVEGCPDEVQKPLAIEVRQARPLVELHQEGGLKGIDWTIRVHPTGVAVATWASRGPAEPRYEIVRVSELRRIEELVAEIAARPPKVLDRRVVDDIDCTLRAFEGTRTLEWHFSRANAQGALLELVGILGGPFAD